MPYPDYKEEKGRLFRGLFYSIIILVGGSFLFGAAYEQYESYNRYKYGITTQGTVVKVYVSSSTDHEVTVYDVQFRASDANLYVINNHYLALDHLYREGQVVPVVYEPEHPEDGRIDSINERDKIVGVPLLVGLFIFLFLALFHYRSFFFGYKSESNI
jgi:Protein of unknown function (DUF3592)